MYTAYRAQIMFEVRTDVTHSRGYVYSLQYHIVFTTKYRRPVFTSAVEPDVRRCLEETLASLEMKVITMEVMPNHIHILVDCKPQLRLSDAIKILKGNTARWLFMSHPKIKKQLWAVTFGACPIL